MNERHKYNLFLNKVIENGLDSKNDREPVGSLCP